MPYQPPLYKTEKVHNNTMALAKMRAPSCGKERDDPLFFVGGEGTVGVVEAVGGGTYALTVM